MAENRYKDWYLANKDQVNERRREKYRTDQRFRDQLARREKLRWAKTQEQRIDERRSRIAASLGSLDLLDSPNTRSVRITLIGETLRKVYSSGLLAQVLGIDFWTLRRWKDRGAIVAPSFVDESGGDWYTREVVEFMREAIKSYRPIHYPLDEFAQAVQHHWRIKNGE